MEEYYDVLLMISCDNFAGPLYMPLFSDFILMIDVFNMHYMQNLFF